MATTGHGCKLDPCLEGASKLSSTCMIDTGGEIRWCSMMLKITGGECCVFMKLQSFT